MHLIRRTGIVIAALASQLFTVANAQTLDPDEAVWAEFTASYLHDFSVEHCRGETGQCKKQALALPVATPQDKVTCLNDVLPTVSYIRDGHAAIGAEYEVIVRLEKPTSQTPASDTSLSFNGITIVNKLGLQNICVPLHVNVHGQRLTLRLSDVNGSPLGIEGSEYTSTLDLGGVFGGIVGRLWNNRRSFSQRVVEAIFGSSATVMVPVSISSPQPDEEVTIGRQSMGRTTIKQVRVAFNALESVRVKVAGRWKRLRDCEVFGDTRTRMYLDFRC